MSATLCIHVSGVSSSSCQDINFFQADEWTIQTEKELLGRLHDLLSKVRNNGVSLDIRINIEVKDLQTTIFHIKKTHCALLETHSFKLSIREIEILGMIMQGLTNNEIAEKLFISYETVKTHRKNILVKSGQKNTASLINYYHQTFFEK